ncbi:hypothetical protein [Streptomyces sp. NPDC059378]|uniref:hypothetical protein n=1 Tax=Streptomyces sp. NPDC059378 TaxID=3346815 RepID=UPI0036B8B22D
MPTALRAMLATLDRDTLIGKRDAALLLLGYATAARASELVALDLVDVPGPTTASRRPSTAER